MLDFLGATENFPAIAGLPWTLPIRFRDVDGDEEVNLDGTTLEGLVQLSGSETVPLDIRASEQALQSGSYTITFPALPEGRWPYEIYAISDSRPAERMLCGHIGVVKSHYPIPEQSEYVARSRNVRLPGDTARRLRLEILASAMTLEYARETKEALLRVEAAVDTLEHFEGVTNEAEEAAARAEAAARQAGNVDSHVSNVDAHVQEGERESWNAKVSQEQLQALIPPGTLIHNIASSVQGYLLCDGSRYSVSAYPELAAVLGVASGDTQFTVPDLRGRVLWGASAEQPAGSPIAAGLPNITGQITHAYGGYAQWVAEDGALDVVTESDSSYVGAGGGYKYDKTITLDASKSSPIYGRSETVQPPALSVNIFIKY